MLCAAEKPGLCTVIMFIGTTVGAGPAIVPTGDDGLLVTFAYVSVDVPEGLEVFGEFCGTVPIGALGVKPRACAIAPTMPGLLTATPLP